MNERQQYTHAALAQIDRLVSGDLPEPDRRSLLAWLDEEPARWRTCGIAFLEAQTWEQASQEAGDRRQGTDSRGPVSTATRHSSVTKHQTRNTARLLHWLVVAGLALAAFSIGLAAGRNWSAQPIEQSQFAQPSSIGQGIGQGAEPLVATVSVRTNLDPRVPAELRLPITAAAAPPGEPAISEYVRQQWERRGFELFEEIRYLPARLSDGRQIMVPVTKVHVKFKGTPVS
jgi:hypothetical protein